jgi:phosphatidylglycerol---prolipoprotein diacylglyceryl transferase
MRRILFHFFGRPVYSYPAMLYLGIVLGIYAELHAATSIGLNREKVLTATLILVTFAMIGARLLHVVSFWNLYRRNLKHILNFSNGGVSSYGVLLVPVPVSVPVLTALGLPFGGFWDVATFTILVSMFMGRGGCFLHGCCSGRPTLSRWGWNLPNHEGVWCRRIPMQVLEVILVLTVLTGATLLWTRLPFQGAIFLYAIVAYGLGRLALESLRAEQDRLRGISVHKAISVGLITASLGAFATIWWP